MKVTTRRVHTQLVSSNKDAQVMFLHSFENGRVLGLLMMMLGAVQKIIG